ncbi:MAG: glycoside hydrolase family 31 protein [Flavobacteriaceae bacterium]|nr:glycoside hydrolase family 31 protein [Flavobacteriaceae bacterium]
MLRNFFLISLSLFFTGFELSAQNPNRQFEEADFKNQKLTIKVSDGHYIIRPFNAFIVETSFIPKGERFSDQSHAVVMRPEADYTFAENDSVLRLTSNQIEVHITKSPFQVAYFHRGKVLVSEALGYIKTDSLEMLDFHLTEKEILMGGGSRALGMNRRGNKLPLYNKAHYGYETRSEQMNFSIPMVLSSQLYALHFDNPYTGFLDLDSNQNNTLTYGADGGRMTYQIVAGSRWQDILKEYTALTGRQPLPPRWAFGNFASRFGYHSQREVAQTVALFQKDSIPLDAVVIDIYWFGKDIKGHMGNLSFYKDSFPQPERMIKDLKAQNVHTVLVTEPFILSTSKRWEEAVAEGVLATDSLGNPFTYDFYFGNTGLVDLYHPRGRKWFWDIYKDLTLMGVSGWWGDLGEPEVHPDALLHLNGPAQSVHNIYGHDWAKLLAEGYAVDFPNQRPFTLMRAGSSGSQRWGMIPWSGDVNRSWGGLQSQPEIALQMGMQGLAYMHSDLGGFAGGEVFDAELYTRWLQYGVFQPIFRPHAQEHIAPEPVFHDAVTKALAKQAIALRYRLLPYNYSLAHQNQQYGLPLMRPLFYEEPDNIETYNIADTYLWGQAFLVSPVLQKAQKVKEIYFPKGSVWFDFYKGKKYQGGKNHRINLVQDHIPTFVRAGAFVPMTKPIQNTQAYDAGQLELHYYFDESAPQSEAEMYHDDGTTPGAFEKGLYEKLHFLAQWQNGHLAFTFHSEVGTAAAFQKKSVEFVLHHVSKKPKSVEVDNQAVDFEWSGKDKMLKLKFNWLSAKDKIIILQY